MLSFYPIVNEAMLQGQDKLQHLDKGHRRVAVKKEQNVLGHKRKAENYLLKRRGEIGYQRREKEAKVIGDDIGQWEKGKTDDSECQCVYVCSNRHALEGVINLE